MGATAEPVTVRDRQIAELVGPVLRDIARGGIAGILAGILVAGLGGRIVMRLAAIAVPTADGRFTENGNRIGELTLSGSLGLILFAGIFFGLFGATVWVVVSPWIPRRGLRRAILAMPIAVALTGIALVKGTNPDFQILANDGRIVAMLLILVALTGLAIALLDGWLDHRLPPAGTAASGPMVLYFTLSLAGAVLIFPVVVAGYFTADARLGLALVALGFATLAWWVLRSRGNAHKPLPLLITGGAALAAASLFGAIELAAEVAAALGAP